jgi:hypothetical protein
VPAVLSSQMFQKCPVYTTAEVLPELEDSHATVGTLIRQWNESAFSRFFDRHFRHDRQATSSRCAIRSWIEICNMTFGKDPRTYDMAARILNEEIEHEAWFIELLAHERDGKTIPSGHFRGGEPGHAPYRKNASFYNP